MTYNTCETCGASDGRAGLLIGGECQNCHQTRETGEITVFSHLPRTEEELQRTFAILDRYKVGDTIRHPLRYGGFKVVGVSQGWYKVYHPSNVKNGNIEEATTSIRWSWVH